MIDLSWSKYIGFPVHYYEILRGPSETDMQLLTTSSAELFSKTDENPPEGPVYYQVAAVRPSPCYPSSKLKNSTTYDRAFSNLDDIVVGTLDAEFSVRDLLVFPNPFSDYTILRFHNPGMQPFTLRITDCSGKTVFIQKNIKTSEFRLEKGDLSPGIYLLELLGIDIYRHRIVVD
jgi:hypothetical protein